MKYGDLPALLALDGGTGESVVQGEKPSEKLLVQLLTIMHAEGTNANTALDPNPVGDPRGYLVADWLLR